jgi:hypothetical protein
MLLATNCAGAGPDTIWDSEWNEEPEHVAKEWKPIVTELISEVGRSVSISTGVSEGTVLVDESIGSYWI